MISPTGFSKLLKDEEKCLPFNKDLESPSFQSSLSELYAQEIEENQINENKEAILRKNSFESEIYENEVKNELHKKATNPVFSSNENPLVLRPKAIPQNAFSYTQNFNFVSKPKPPLFPKPRYTQRINFREPGENEAVILSQDLKSDVIIDPKPITDTPCSRFNSQFSTDSQRIGDHFPNNSPKNKIHRLVDSGYIKLEDTETVPPPLPTRPPPVFKYPLGTFYKETENITESSQNDQKESLKQIQCLQSESCLSDGTRKDSSMNFNDEIIKTNGRNFNQETIPIISEIKSIGTPSEISEYKFLKSLPMLDLELKVNKDNLRSSSQETNSVAVQKRPISAPVIIEKSQKNTQIGESKVNIRKSIPLKSNPELFQKRSISAPLGTQVNKPPQPLPRSGIHINAENLTLEDYPKRSNSAPLGTQASKPPQPLPRPELLINNDSKKNFIPKDIPGAYPKKSICTPFEMRKPLKPLLIPDLEVKRSIGTTQTRKSAESQVMDFERTKEKPNVPKKPNILFHQRLEKILVEQRIQEQECLNPVSRLRQSLEKNLSEFSDSKDMSQATIQENISETKKMDFSIGSKIDNESLMSKSDNFQIENIMMDSSSGELRDEEGKSDYNQDNNQTDFSAFHSLNRPTLPQKMKSTQRSLSYTSLVQTVKDIGATIWNPSDKSKRVSTGMIPKVTEEMVRKNELSASEHTIDTKFLVAKRSPEEEKAAIVRSTWFHDISATEAQHRLLKLDQDGAFLIRPTSRPTDNVQYTASITYAGRVFNIHIRRKANYYFVLGKEKEGEKSFQTLSDLIKYYQDVPFDIHPVGSSDPHGICFRVTPPR